MRVEGPKSKGESQFHSREKIAGGREEVLRHEGESLMARDSEGIINISGGRRQPKSGKKRGVSKTGSCAEVATVLSDGAKNTPISATGKKNSRRTCRTQPIKVRKRFESAVRGGEQEIFLRR